MSKLLLVSHDGGTWAYQADNDAELKDRLAIEFFGEPWGKLQDEHEELNEILKELLDDGRWIGEQCSATLYQDGGVGGWRAEKAVISAAKELLSGVALDWYVSKMRDPRVDHLSSGVAAMVENSDLERRAAASFERLRLAVAELDRAQS